MTKRILCVIAVLALTLSGTAFAGIDEDLMVLMHDINNELALADANVRVERIEYLTAGDQLGRTVFFNNVGNKQLALDFVPGDPRRAWSGPVGADDDITWATDLTEGDAGVGVAATQQAIANAMATWDGADCSDMPLTQVAVGGDLGYLQFLLTGGAQGSFPVADVVHAGFGSIVDVLLPPPIIAATFTLQFVSGGQPTDIDNNGRADVALREIYYTNNFLWGVGNFIDIETVVLHETGHALSQAHFGTLSRTDSNGKFHFSPRAVMNAGYTGVQRDLGKTDLAGHCSNWASWPQH